MSKIDFVLNVNNIGPHVNLKSNNQISSLQIGIYANNGSGKTFLSRALRCSEMQSELPTNKLISFNHTKGSLTLAFNNPHDNFNKNRQVEILLESDKKPNVKNDSGYIFHTFNSDYVKDNLEILGYKLDGNVEGYILGKELIDLSKEKEALEKVLQSVSEDELLVKQDIKAHKLELDNLQVRSSTTEYIAFSYENILNSKHKYPSDKSFDDLKRENSILNTLPDDLPDVPEYPLVINFGVLKDLENILETAYTTGQFTDEFKKKITSKKDFIESGLAYLKDQNCPFCEQSFGLDAVHLIDEYRKYMADEEAKVISKINLAQKSLEQLIDSIRGFSNKSLHIKKSFDTHKNYLPSAKVLDLKDIPDGTELVDGFSSLHERLEYKKTHISSNQLDNTVVNIVKASNAFIQSLLKDLGSNNLLIRKVNSIKSDIKSEKLRIKKRLCMAKHNLALVVNKQRIENIKLKQEAAKSLEADIHAKEQKVRASKKDKVADTFEQYLDNFFAGKYTFDRNNFCLKFDTYQLIDNASDVLSDGEKSIVAFCYYLAETHKKVNSEEEYKYLFFVIDDPISSLDFHYVYSVAQIIRKLNVHFPIGTARFIVLTHNIEFMSILIRNKIITGHFSLRNQCISKLNKELIMPYEEHLRDIYEIATNAKIPSHTTPNSIRHVLETLQKFEKPNLDLQVYFSQIQTFNECSYLYSLIHDNSHGNFRQEKAYLDDMVKMGCIKLIEFIKERFEGQISALQKTS